MKTQRTFVARFKGFSLMEALISLTLVGVLGALTIRMIQLNERDHRTIAPVIGASAELAGAYARYLRGNPPDTTITAASVVANLNTVRPDTAGTTVLQTNAANPATLTCDATTACVILHNGAYVLYEPTATFTGGSGNPGTTVDTYDNALWFFVDPDGPDIQAAVPLVLFYTGRVAPLAQSNPTNAQANIPVPDFSIPLPGGFPAGTADPDYLQTWTAGTYN